MSLRSLVLASVACLASTAAALAESRMALVIGNSSYQAVGALTNPANDAQAMGELLSTAGFNVVLARDLGRADMQQTIRDFTASVSAKGADNVVLVFYAGHGLQVEGENFLVPVDARIEKESDIRAGAFSLVELMKELQAVPSLARIVILDACRNNPFAAVQKVTGRGLAIVDAPSGSMVAYSTSPGTEASDGVGTNSPYTAALVETIREPGLQVEQLFKKVRVRLGKSTDGRQIPWETSSLTVNFAFFAPVVVATPAPAKPTDPPPPAAPPKPAVVPVEKKPEVVAAETAARVARIKVLPPSEAYDLALEEDTVEAYQQFVQTYPTDPLCDRIRRILFRRQQMVAWQSATLSNTSDAYEAYLSRFPYSDHAATATRLRYDPRPAIDPVVAPRNFPFPRFPSQNDSRDRPGSPGFPGGPGGPGGPFKPPGQGSPVVTLPPSQNNPPPGTPPGTPGNTGPFKPPVITTIPPKTGTGAPIITTLPPKTGTGAPIITTLPPKTGTGAPIITTLPPKTGTGAPVITTLPPKTGTGAPVITTLPPKTGTGAPIITTIPPKTGTGAPVITTLPPKTGTDSPPFKPPVITTFPSRTGTGTGTPIVTPGAVVRLPTDSGRFRQPPIASPVINASPTKAPVFTPSPTGNRFGSIVTRNPSGNSGFGRGSGSGQNFSR